MDQSYKQTINKSKYPILYMLLLMLQNNFHIQAQPSNFSTQLISVHVKEAPLHQVLTMIEQQTSYKFAYNTDLIAKQKNITIDAINDSLGDILLLVLKGTNITYSVIDNQIILQEIAITSNVTISGYIKDKISGESLPEAEIYLPATKTGTYANRYGFYSITQNQTDSLEILISYIGFNKIYKKVPARHNSTVNFQLTESDIQLNVIQINNDRPDDDIKKNHAGKTSISMDMIRAAPSVNGNGDIINTIQMMPGVMAGLDGRSGYFIRGGNTDQNLVLLDDATIYNPSHLLGLVSIFNTSAIQHVSLLKGGFPASFGDHLSSVLDVTLKDGNNQELGGDLQIGTISGGFTLNGPLLSNNATFFLAARRSTVDLILKPIDLSNYYSDYKFFDVNAKLGFKISAKDRLFLSIYQGGDHSAYSTDTTARNPINYNLSYGNQALTFRWNHLFSQKIFANTTILYNNYYHSVTARQHEYYADLYSGIRDLNFKFDMKFYPNMNQQISAGVNYLYQTLFPATITNKTISAEPDLSINPSQIPGKYSSRLAGYFSDELRLSHRFSAYLGARVPFFYQENNQDFHFEPRLALLYLVNPATSIKISYTQMHQYLHLVQSYNASFPAEIWIGSTKIVKPQNCQQTSIGIFKNFQDNMFQSSLEVYYKHMGNQLLFKGGLTPVINNNIENLLIFGQGQSYGTELFIEKTRGKFTGWLSYTLSYAYQKFDSLNLGKQFPFANDRRHCLYISASYALTKHWDISSNFSYTSGGAFTLFKNVTTNPSYKNYNPLYYNIQPDELLGNSSSNNRVQNNFRLASYNRLDLSLSYKKTRNMGNRVMESAWVFSLYNVYARVNTYFAYCSIDPVTNQPIAVQVSFVPIIPTISYRLKF